MGNDRWHWLASLGTDWPHWWAKTGVTDGHRVASLLGLHCNQGTDNQCPDYLYRFPLWGDATDRLFSPHTISLKRGEPINGTSLFTCGQLWLDPADHMGEEPRLRLFTEIGVAPCPWDTARSRSPRCVPDWTTSYDVGSEHESILPALICLYGGQEAVKGW